MSIYLNKVPGEATLRSGPTRRPHLTHLVCRDGELLGAVHHLRRPVFSATQSLAALVQSLAGLLHGARHAVGGRVQDTVTWGWGGRRGQKRHQGEYLSSVHLCFLSGGKYEWKWG